MNPHTPEQIIEVAARANSQLIPFFKQEIPKLLARHHEIFSGDMQAVFNLTRDPEEYIDGGLIRRIGGLYRDDEIDLILRLSEKFERVKYGFAYFSLLDSNLRPFEALRMAEYQLRTGWQRADVPMGFNQNVGEHQRSVELLAFLLFFDDPDLELIERICRYHDIGEAVIGDFTPYCDITKDEKKLIERFALRLVCSAWTRNLDMDGKPKPNAFPHPIAKPAYDAVMLYEGDDPRYDEVRRKVKDCDLLEMCGEALFLMANCPKEERTALNGKLQEFWDYVGPRLTTKRAQDYFHSLQTARYAHEVDEERYGRIVGHAHQYMLLQDEGGIDTWRKYDAMVAARFESGRFRERASVSCAGLHAP